MAVRTVKAAGGGWGTIGTWVEGAVPTPSDDVVFEAGSGTLTLEAESKCRSIDFTGFKGVFARGAQALAVGTSTVNGTLALRFVAGMTTTGTGKIEFKSTSATQIKIYSGGLSLEGNTAFVAPGGSYLLEEAWKLPTGTLTHTSGTFNTNGYELQAANLRSNGSATRVLTLEASLVVLSGGEEAFSMLESGFTLNAGTSTIRFTGAGAAKQLKSAGFITFYRVEFLGTGSPGITGENTFTFLKRSNAAACGVIFPSALATKFLNAPELSGTAGNLVSCKSSTKATRYKLKLASGVVSNDYVNLEDCNAEGGASWYWGTHSVREANNVNCIFTARTTVPQALGRGPCKLAMITLSNDELADYQAINTLIKPRSLDVLMLYNGWQSNFLFSSNEADAREMNAIPQIAWQLVKECQGTLNTGTLKNLTTGVLDAFIKTSAEAAKAFGKEIYIRLCHEFNQPGPHSYGAGKETGAEFVEGWQYLVNKFAAEGVTNVKWLWSPNTWRVTAGSAAVDPTEYYPGDAYVDIIGLDSYMNKLSPFILWPDTMFLDNYLTLTTAITTTKPLWIFETGVATDARFGATKKAWYEALFALIQNQMPLCKGLCYWARTEAEATEGNYSIDDGGADPEAKAAFVAGVTSLPFLPQRKRVHVA